MAQATDLKKQLWLLAELTALRRGFKFRPDCKAHLLDFIATGVSKLIADDAAGSEARTAAAEGALIAFVETMVSEAIKEGLEKLHEHIFDLARSRFCPLWPFC